MLNCITFISLCHSSSGTRAESTTFLPIQCKCSYCVQPFKWNNDVCQTTLLQSMVMRKGCHAFLCVTEKEGKRANYWRDTEREWVRGGACKGDREIVWVQRSRYLPKCNMISRMNGVDKVTICVRQNDTSVFLIGDI